VVDGAGTTILRRLVRPSSRIPSEVTEIHGIDDATVADAPAWPEVFAEFARLLPRYASLVVYNASFDRRIINQVNHWHGLPPWRWIGIARCGSLPPMLAAAIRWSEPSAVVGVPIGSTHRALDDTRICRRLVHAMAASAHDRARLLEFLTHRGRRLPE
jgi:DNA polymerase-3 subunit epsilon